MLATFPQNCVIFSYTISKECIQASCPCCKNSSCRKCLEIEGEELQAFEAFGYHVVSHLIIIEIWITVNQYAHCSLSNLEQQKATSNGIPQEKMCNTLRETPSQEKGYHTQENMHGSYFIAIDKK